MGLKVKYLNFFFSSLVVAGIKWHQGDRRMCELGNQILKYDDPLLEPYMLRIYEGKPLPHTGKEFFSFLGFEHTSIDINGKDGALKLDLCKPLPVEMHKKFNILTNFGTIEHVENQEKAFENVWNLLDTGGIVVHIAPMAGGMLHNHGKHQYSKDFFYEMVKTKGYEFLLYPGERESIPGCITVSMRKV